MCDRDTCSCLAQYSRGRETLRFAELDVELLKDIQEVYKQCQQNGRNSWQTTVLNRGTRSQLRVKQMILLEVSSLVLIATCTAAGYAVSRGRVPHKQACKIPPVVSLAEK